MHIDNIIKEKNNGGNMFLYPQLYLNSIKEITIEVLEKYGLKGLILDVDNTLIDYNKNILNGTEEWAEELKKKNIKLCIASNSNNKEKVENVAKKLNIPYIYFAKKPLTSGLKKATKILQLEANQTAVVGDQIFTDVLGANSAKMFSILVKPIEEKDILITKIKRPFEKLIIKKYINKKEQ